MYFFRFFPLQSSASASILFFFFFFIGILHCYLFCGQHKGSRTSSTDEQRRAHRTQWHIRRIPSGACVSLTITFSFLSNLVFVDFFSLVSFFAIWLRLNVFRRIFLLLISRIKLKKKKRNETRRREKKIDNERMFAFRTMEPLAKKYCPSQHVVLRSMCTAMNWNDRDFGGERARMEWKNGEGKKANGQTFWLFLCVPVERLIFCKKWTKNNRTEEMNCTNLTAKIAHSSSTATLRLLTHSLKYHSHWLNLVEFFVYEIRPFAARLVQFI